MSSSPARPSDIYSATIRSSATAATAASPRSAAPGRDKAGRIIGDDSYRAHRRIRARVEHVIARIKDWQILRQCRPRGNAINHSLQIVAGLWNLKASSQLRVNS
jgi:hypothetical protein